MSKYNKKKIVAICTSDWHFSHKPPVWRSNEPDWYVAMERPLHEIKDLQEKYNCPILVAGDIFDKWNSPPELINWAMEHVPARTHTIPGQHDTPNHNRDEIDKSAYQTLSKANIIEDLPNGCDGGLRNISEQNMTIWAFPFGIKIAQEHRKTQFLKVALVHDYVWIKEHSYPNAPKEKYLFGVHGIDLYPDKKWHGYDAVIFGDNHSGFLIKIGNTTIFNCGTLMRRKSDEENYKPQVGLLYSDGSIQPHYLDISEDKHLTADEAKKRKAVEELDMNELATEIRKLGSSALDFADAVKQYCDSKDVAVPVHKIIQKAMERK
jgi:DNA repair exonuclease SbcCD nuclease subunit